MDTLPREPAYQPNFVLEWLYERFFAQMDVDPAWVRTVRGASARGAVVHVMRSQSYLDFVALDFFLKKFALPPLGFVSDTGLWILEPMGRGLRKLMLRSDEPEERRLARVVADDQAALLFMRRPPDLAQPAHRGRRVAVDHIRVLLDLQRGRDEAILLLPQVFVWGKSPDAHHKTAVDLVFGPTDYPGRIRQLAHFLRNYRHALLRAGEAVDLRAFLAENAGLDPEAAVRKIHWMLFRRLDRERRMVLGPVAKGADRLGLEILQTPRVRHAIAESAAREKRAPELVTADVYRELRRLEARPDPTAIDLADRWLALVFSRIYDGVEVDAEGFARIREAARRGPVVLLPSHKSHVDYLLLSWVCYHQGLQTPLIAAGDNLRFWPLGPVLRRCGAFFIRRSLQGEDARLYAVLLDAYVRKVMREGYFIEFFFEGGRSRTGRVLAPKMGLLAMVLAAAAAGRERVSLVPLSIAYDRVAEGRSYVDQLLGGAKKSEDVAALLRAPQVLAQNYGRAYLEVGEIVEVEPEPADPQADAGVTAAAAKGGRAERERLVTRRSQVTRIAHRLVEEIQRVTPVTPSSLLAAALLSHPGRGVTRLELLDAVDRLAALLATAEARLPPTLRRLDGRGVPERTVDRGLALFRDAGLVQLQGAGLDAAYVVPDDRRLAMDYYKNNVLHFLAPRALVATALLAAGVGATRDAVVAGAERLGTIFRRDFEYRAPADRRVDATLAAMLVDGDIVETAGVLRVRDEDGAAWLGLLAGALRSCLEAYRVVARTLGELVTHPEGSLPLKELVARALAVGRRMFLAGQIHRAEAISTANFEGALGAFRELGYLGGGEGGPQRLKSPWDTAEAVQKIEAEITAFLP